MKSEIKVILLEDAETFITSLPLDVRKKIEYVIMRIIHGDRDEQIFKKLTSTNIWEIRVRHMRMCYRIFAFWDKFTNSLIVCTHGLVKKTQKTPIKEIDRAEKIMDQYYRKYERN